MPKNYKGSNPTLWLHTPEPAIILPKRKFNPKELYRPRIFLWLPHFLVKELRCPQCNSILEKNGAIPPRRITDIEDSFYIVTWSYYCRSNCLSTFRGWSPQLLQSLPPYIQLAFPAFMSRKSGLSKQVMSQLRVGNQHKMGPSGVHSLLVEMHTLRYNALQLQYCEAVFEEALLLEQDQQSQEGLKKYFSSSRDHYEAFGNFSDPHRYAGFVPSERYLSSMLNKAIEMEEADANQHTSCLEPDQIAIDDSHKVNTMFESFCQCSILLSKMHIQGERAYCEGGWGACILGTLDLHDEPVYPKADIDTHKIT